MNMFYFWLGIIIAAFAWYQVRRDRKVAIALRSQYALYKLRDELRELAMRRGVDSSGWVFQYLDSSIAKTIAVLPDLNLVAVIMVGWVHRHDERMKLAQTHLRRELGKPENAPLAEIHREYVMHCVCYFAELHSMSVLFLAYMMKVVSLGVGLKRRCTESVTVLTEAPETSTLTDWAFVRRRDRPCVA